MRFHRAFTSLARGAWARLRAAELWEFGMVGVGAVFAAYRDNHIEDDDEVAVIHGPAELDYLPLSEAMVNVRATVDRAVSESIISNAVAAVVLQLTKATFYKERTWARALEQLRSGGADGSQAAAFEAWLRRGIVDQKRLDALEKLEAIRQLLAAQPNPFRASFEFEETADWQQAVTIFTNSQRFRRSLRRKIARRGDFLHISTEAWEIRAMTGFDIVVIVLVVFAVIVLISAVKTVSAGPQLHGRALRPLHQDAEARPQHDRAVRRPHRLQDEHDGDGAGGAEPGGDHQGQRHGDGERHHLLPGDGRGARGLRGEQARERHPEPHHDQHPLGHGLDGPRRAALQPRRDQPAAAARRRRRGRAVGRQDHPHRDQGHRPAEEPRRIRWRGR